MGVVTSTSCGEEIDTKTKQIAMTDTKSEYPCCYPGHCLDGKLGRCNNCYRDYMLPMMANDERCREPLSCEEGQPAQLENGLEGQATLFHDLQHGGSVRQDCPKGFEGTVELRCDLGKLSVAGQNCRIR